MTSKWFTADLHFGHRNVIEYCNRPFTSTEEMDAALVEKWNSLVQPDDTIYVLGDVFFCSATRARTLMDHLYGKKILIRGNHDGKASKMHSFGFDVVLDEAVFVAGGHRFRMSHYPYAPRWWQRRGSDVRYLDRRPHRHADEVLLHGHRHSRPDEVVRGRMVDVGVDGNGYAPYSLDELIVIANRIG